VRQYRIRYRLQHLFFPILLVTVSFAVGYSFLSWLLVFGNDILPIDEQVVEYWLPLALSAIFVATWVSPHVGSLKLSEKRNLPTLYFVIAVAVVAAPTVIAQFYVRAASGTLTRLENAWQISAAAKSKYYSARSICLARNQAIARPVTFWAGRNNTSLNFYLYVLVPVCEVSPGQPGRRIWIGLIFHKIATGRTDTERRSEWVSFVRASEQSVNTENPKLYRYLESAGINFDSRNFEKALQANGLASSMTPIILIPHKEAFEGRTGKLLPWLFRSLAIGMAIWLVLILLPAIDPKRVEEPTNRRATDGKGSRFFASLFLAPTWKNYGLPLLIDLNIAVFLVMVFAGLGVESIATDDLRAWGANYGPDIHGLGVFRLVTNQFVHAGLMHIASNLYGLAFAGLFLLPVVRNWRLLVCYLLSGLGGSLAGLMIHPNVVSVGASGAIMGLWGILLVLALFRDRRVVDSASMILLNAAIFVGLTLLFGAVARGIDNAAHIGGLLTGMVLGALIVVFELGDSADELERLLTPSTSAPFSSEHDRSDE
jgi:membrane associated rhomboid family serine protease